MIRPEDFEPDEDEMDDEDFEEWCAMSEEQQDAILDAEMGKAVAARARAQPAQLYAHDRKQRLLSVIRWRRLMKAQGFVGDFWDEQLRNRQRSLMKLRLNYYHQVVGSA